MIKIKSIAHLKELSENIQLDCFISLNGGFRSSKSITYDIENNLFEIYNEIDDSEQLLKDDELYSESNIGEAIDKGALLKYE